MIYLELLLEFLKIGFFAFGGAYGAIPLIQEVVFSNGWMSEEMFSNMLAISESTPGPIMVNAATYIGNTKAGIFGAAVATLGVVLPAFFIVIIVVCVFQKLLQNVRVQKVLQGIKCCLMGVIIATGFSLLFSNIFDITKIKSTILEITKKDNLVSSGINPVIGMDFQAMIILLILLFVSGGYAYKMKKPVSPLLLIAVAAVSGLIIY